jgi:hypothetical protein
MLLPPECVGLLLLLSLLNIKIVTINICPLSLTFIAFKPKDCWIQWCAPVIPAKEEVVVGGSKSRPALDKSTRPRQKIKLIK